MGVGTAAQGLQCVVPKFCCKEEGASTLVVDQCVAPQDKAIENRPFALSSPYYNPREYSRLTTIMECHI